MNRLNTFLGERQVRIYQLDASANAYGIHLLARRARILVYSHLPLALRPLARTLLATARAVNLAAVRACPNGSCA
jgi:hypothetical protein